MKACKDANTNGELPPSAPLAIRGSGNLVSFIQEAPNGGEPFWNLFRWDASTGGVGQLYHASDVQDLVGLAQALAIYFADDESVDRELRDDLACLASCLGELTGISSLDVASRQQQ